MHSPAALQQVSDPYAWIASESGSELRAQTYTNSIVNFCDSLAPFPFIGTARDDIRPGLRTIGFRRRVTIAFATENDVVKILGTFLRRTRF